jgi:hypothetical protein
MALEDVEVDLDDNTLTLISTPVTIESSNTVSLVVGRVGAAAGVRDEARSEVRAGGWGWGWKCDE